MIPEIESILNDHVIKIETELAGISHMANLIVDSLNWDDIPDGRTYARSVNAHYMALILIGNKQFDMVKRLRLKLFPYDINLVVPCGSRIGSGAYNQDPRVKFSIFII